MKKLMGGAAALAVLAAVMASSAQDAEAAFVMKLSDSAGNTVTIADGGANDSSSLAGVIIYNGTLSNGTTWIVNVTTGISAPFIGSPTLARMDLNSVNVSSSGAAGSLTIALSINGIGSPAGNVHALMEIGGTTDGTLQYSAYVDGSNTLFGTGSALGATGPLGSGAFSTQLGSALSALGSPYSITQVVTINHGRGFQATSFNAGVKVPEPASLALFGIGLLGLGFLGRRRARRALAA